MALIEYTIANIVVMSHEWLNFGIVYFVHASAFDTCRLSSPLRTIKRMLAGKAGKR